MPYVPGRHIVRECANFMNINPKTLQPRQPVHLFLLNDCFLVASRKKRSAASKYRLVADFCWNLSDLSLMDVRDSPGKILLSVYVRSWIRGTAGWVLSTYKVWRMLSKYQCTPTRYYSALNDLKINSLCWMLISGQSTRMKIDRTILLIAVGLRGTLNIIPDIVTDPYVIRWFQVHKGTGMKSWVICRTRIQSAYTWKDMGAARATGAQAKQDADIRPADAKWLIELPDELEVAIALRQFEEAVSYIEQGEWYMTVGPK